MPRIIAVDDSMERVRVTLNGVTVAAMAGETIAGMMISRGDMMFHETQGGRPSGPYCAMGTCFGCRVEVARAGGPPLVVRACVTQVEAGMTITTGTSFVAGMRGVS